MNCSLRLATPVIYKDFKSDFTLCFRDSNIHVTDFGPSWRDGIAFLAIIDAIKANLINLAEMRRKSNRQRLEHAFDVAETELGIARLLDPEDVDVDKPDERSIMTYVAQFLHKYPEPKVSSFFIRTWNFLATFPNAEFKDIY